MTRNFFNGCFARLRAKKIIEKKSKLKKFFKHLCFNKINPYFSLQELKEDRIAVSF